jgi:hypothetical protein
MRRWPSSRRLAIAATATAVVVATIALPSTAGAAPVTETFEHTGSTQTFTVPDDVCRVTAVAYGAQGGGNRDTGGLGGQATTELDVTPGETLVIEVGGQGALGGIGTAGGTGVGGVGGYNGGADGGDGTDLAFTNEGGSGGGGATDVRQTGNGLDARVLVAGGGGGGGGVSSAEGGDGGGQTGDAGGDGGGGSTGGGGGTQTAGGAAGSNATSGTATAGSAGAGGTGGSSAADSVGGGGGGGGGWFGGGGGGDASSVSGGASSGGGGSGFGSAGVSFVNGVRSGDGQLQVTYDSEAGTCETDAPVDAVDQGPVAAKPAFTG